MKAHAISRPILVYSIQMRLVSQKAIIITSKCFVLGHNSHNIEQIIID